MPLVDYIYFLQDGHITEQGTYAELIAQGNDFAKLIEDFGNSDDAEERVQEKEGEAKTGDATKMEVRAKGNALMQDEVRSSGCFIVSIMISDG